MTEAAQAVQAGDATASTEIAAPENVIPQGESLDLPAEPTENTESAVMEEMKAEEDDGIELPELSDQQMAKLLRKAKIKHKVDGEEVEIDIESLKKAYGLDKVATKRLQEAGELKKTALQQAQQAAKDALAQHLDGWKKDPRQALDTLERLGVDTRQLAKDMVWEEIQDSKKTPEQRELEALRRYKDEQDQMAKAQEEAAKAEKLKADNKVYENNIQDLVMETLKVGKFKPTAISVARISEIMQHHIRAKNEVPSPEVIAAKVRRWYDQDITDFTDVGEKYSIDDVKAIYERLPKTTQQGFKKLLIEEAQATKAAKLQASQRLPEQQSKSKKKKIGVDDFFKQFE
jgi:hypothetical protein